MSLLLRSVLILFAFCSCTSENSPFLNCTNEQAKYPLYFVGFFPCLPDEHECNRLTLTAVELAIEDINQNDSILECFDIKLLPVHVNDPEQNPTEIFKLLYDRHGNLPIHGIIGPFHTDIAVIFSYVLGLYLPTIQISYSITDPMLEDKDKFPYFYSTVPSDRFFGKVVSKLLDKFNWRKVAILSTNDRHHVLASQKLTILLRKDGKIVDFLGSYFESASNALMTAQVNNTRIFIAAILPDSARSLLCQAYRIGLTTSDHVWILPGIYDPKWWYLDDDQLANNTLYNGCTNEQIKEAINSTLFIDSLPVNSEDNFDEAQEVLSEILNKTSIFEGSSFSLTNSEFHEILHSKLLNAYDATKALALTWNVTLSNYTINELLNLLNQSWKSTNNSKQDLANTLQYNLEKVISPYKGLSARYDFGMNRSIYGSSLITQFKSSQECIIGWYDLFNGSEIGPIKRCTWDECCNATWKGGYLPNDGYCPEGSCTCRILDTSTVVLMILLTVLLTSGIVISIALQVVNYQWRTNKFFRSSSPLINAIITFGCTMEYVTGIFYLANYYIGIKGSASLTPICNVTLCLFWLSLIVINSSIFMKNWRIFRIFYNPSHKERRNLSNKNLIIGILIMFLPVILVLLALLSFQRVTSYQVSFVHTCPNISDSLTTYHIEDHCIESLAFGWDGIIASYIFIIFVSIVILGSYNCRIVSHYKKEGELAILTGVFSMFCFMVFYVFALVNTYGYKMNAMIKNHLPIAVSALWLYGSFILAVLYMSKAIAILREREFRPPKRRSTLRRKYADLSNQLFIWRNRLKKINDDVKTATMERKTSNDSSHSTGTMLTIDL